MLNLTERARRFDFWAYVAPDTIDVISDRIQEQLAARRRMTLVSRFLTPDSTLHVTAGLTVRRVQPWTQSWPNGKGLTVDFAPGVESFGVTAYSDLDPNRRDTEGIVAERYQARRDGTRRGYNHQAAVFVRIDGRGTGRSDTITVTDYNADYVGSETVIVFDPGPDTDD